MFFVLSIYSSFTTRCCFLLFRFSHLVTTRIVVPFGPRKFLLLHLRPHTCSLWNLLQTRLTFHSNRYIRPIRVDEYAVQLFGPGTAAWREEDDRGSERKRAIARDTTTRVEEGIKRMSVKAPIWCVTLFFLCFDFSFKFPFVIFRYTYNHLSSSPCVLHAISRYISRTPSRIRIHDFMADTSESFVSHYSLSRSSTQVPSIEDRFVSSFFNPFSRCSNINPDV